MLVRQLLSTATLAIVFVSHLLTDLSLVAQESVWETIETDGLPTARHEAALVGFDQKLFLIGGRRVNPIDVFDPLQNRWTSRSKTPLELHHFQAVVIDDAIYLMGAMTGGFPREKPLEKVVVYYPKKDEFEFIHSIPEHRRRGGAGAVLYDDKIYLVGGITNGHVDGYQPWLDEYDPKTGDWNILPDAPHRRDHFQAAVVGDKLFAVAGRRTSDATDQCFELTVPEVDVFDLTTRKWLEQPYPNLPTQRAGNMVAAIGNDLLVGGGESITQQQAHSEVEILDTKSGTWRTASALNRGRHGSGFVQLGDYLYTASGSGNRGGGPELTSLERAPVGALVAKNAPPSVRLHEPLTLSFLGPETSETDSPNPFTDYRLQVTFRKGDTQHVIRGYYAADGNAGESGSASGNVWRVKFSPDMIGTWEYQASFRGGKDIALQSDAAVGEAIEIKGSQGVFEVLPHSESSRDFATRGRIVASDGFFRFQGSDEYWLKGGADSPENLLAYEGFDGTYRISTETTDGEAQASEQLHTYEPHVADWKPDDPTWQSGKGKGLIGALNYLASQGMNSSYFLTMNIGGDGKDVWPYHAPDDFERFDCSKLDQWDVVFSHMQDLGILLHVTLQETENETLLDDGDTGRHRQLYLLELIARFGHHPALVWNLGEENGPAEWTPIAQTNEQELAMAAFIKANDPYQHPVVIHTHADQHGKEEILTGLLGDEHLDGLSFQVSERETVHDEILHWKHLAAKSGRPWLIGMDEIGKWHTGVKPDADDPNHDTIRRYVLWGGLMAGAAGVEWYFGAKFPHNDLTCEDWRSRERVWELTHHALTFFDKIPFWEMTSQDDLVNQQGAYCLAKANSSYAIYLPAQTDFPARVNLAAAQGSFSVRWFDPLQGGDLQAGTVASVEGGGRVEIGLPPGDATQDWVILINR